MSTTTSVVYKLSGDDLLRVFTKAEVCERAGISERTFERHVRQGRIILVPGSAGSGRTPRVAAAHLYEYLYGGAA